MRNNLNPVSLGLACGITLGLMAMILTFICLQFGWGNHMVEFLQSFIRFETTIKGAIVALVMGVIDGFIIGFMIAQIYNWISDYSSDNI